MAENCDRNALPTIPYIVLLITILRILILLIYCFTYRGVHSVVRRGVNCIVLFAPPSAISKAINTVVHSTKQSNLKEKLKAYITCIRIQHRVGLPAFTRNRPNRWFRSGQVCSLYFRC